MKRKYLFCIAALITLTLYGCTKNPDQVEYIGAEQAKQLAVSAAGLTAADTASLTADLNSRSGTDYYLITFTANEEAYRYDIDALTGVVIDSEVPEKAAEPVSVPADPASAPDKKAPFSRISAETALETALSHAELSKDQVTIVKNTLDTEHGRKVYDIEFYSSDYTEYDYDIDADSGEILTYSRDQENTNLQAATNNNGTNNNGTNGAAITPEKAKELALAQVPGATVTDIWEFETDYDDGRTEYEGKIIYNGMEYEFEIDAYSGAFRSWETEPVD